MKNKLIFPIGLSLISGVGPITAKKLISYCRGVEAVFNEKRSNLLKIPQIGVKLADEISRQSVNDIAYHLNWNKNHFSNLIQMSLFNDEEQLIIDLLKENSEMHVDNILSATNFDYGKMAILLTNLELKNVIYSKPGKVFCVKSNFN